MSQAVRLQGRQRGAVLFLALIVLVAMLLSGIALFRTADSGVLAAGNLALQRSAVSQADRGIADASQWLLAKAGAIELREDPLEPGYIDTPFYIADALDPAHPIHEPASGQGWLAWWNGYVSTHPPKVLPQDVSTGQTVSYLIQRLCSANGFSNAAGNDCARPFLSEESQSNQGQSQRHDAPTLKGSGPEGAVYYRIIVRVDGPRNTTAFVQAIVSL